jgi:hypothetical protein
MVGGQEGARCAPIAAWRAVGGAVAGARVGGTPASGLARRLPGRRQGSAERRSSAERPAARSVAGDRALAVHASEPPRACRVHRATPIPARPGRWPSASRTGSRLTADRYDRLPHDCYQGTGGLQNPCSEQVQWAWEELNLRPLPCQIQRAPAGLNFGLSEIGKDVEGCAGQRRYRRPCAPMICHDSRAV